MYSADFTHSRRIHSTQSQRKSSPDPEETNLKNLSFGRLRYDLGVRHYRVYGAVCDGEELVPIIDEHRAKRKGVPQPSIIVPKDQEDTPFTELQSLRGKLRQSLIWCQHTPLQPSFAHSEPRLLPVLSDLKRIFAKNVQGDPFQVHGRKYNPWEFEDYVIHLPYFIEIGEEHPHKSKSHGGYCCVLPKEQLDVESSWNIPFAPKTRLPVKESVEHVGFCFRREAITISVYDCVDTENEKRLHKNAQSLSTNWSALVIDPGSFFQETLKDPASEFRHGELPPSERNPWRKAKKGWPQDQNADLFQTRLIEVALKNISQKFEIAISKVEQECSMFEEDARRRMMEPSYWREEINTTLVESHQLSRGLGILEDSITDIIGDFDEDALDNGMWRKFRQARPRKRITLLEKELERQADGTRTAREPLDVKATNAQINRLKHILWEVCDVHRHRLVSVKARMRARREAINSLRELLIELSQTRASLYANQLGDHVKYLTYVSIIFLPLGFCTALWSMNYDLFPKGAFIATVCLTSAATVVFLIILILWHHGHSVVHRKI